MRLMAPTGRNWRGGRLSKIPRLDRSLPFAKHELECGMLYLIVFLGAGIGGALRHGVNGLALKLAGPDFPVGTMVINILGSLAMGLIAGYFTYRGGTGVFGQLGQHWRL